MLLVPLICSHVYISTHTIYIKLGYVNKERHNLVSDTLYLSSCKNANPGLPVAKVENQVKSDLFAMPHCQNLTLMAIVTVV